MTARLTFSHTGTDKGSTIERPELIGDPNKVLYGLRPERWFNTCLNGVFSPSTVVYHPEKAPIDERISSAVRASQLHFKALDGIKPSRRFRHGCCTELTAEFAI